MSSSHGLSSANTAGELLAMVENNADLRASLCAIAYRIHACSDGAASIPLLDWQSWLDDEGYDTDVLRSFFLPLTQSQGMSDHLITAGTDATTESMISLLEEENPELLESILQSIDHSVKIHGDLFGLAGGTARPSIRSALRDKTSKKLATKEAAAESAPRDTGSTSAVYVPASDPNSVNDTAVRGTERAPGPIDNTSRAGNARDLGASNDTAAKGRDGIAEQDASPRDREQRLNDAGLNNVPIIGGRGGTENLAYSVRTSEPGRGGDQTRYSRVYDQVSRTEQEFTTNVGGPGSTENDRDQKIASSEPMSNRTENRKTTTVEQDRIPEDGRAGDQTMYSRAYERRNDNTSKVDRLKDDVQDLELRTHRVYDQMPNIDIRRTVKQNEDPSSEPMLNSTENPQTTTMD